MLPNFKIVCERWKYNAEYNVYVSNLGQVKDFNKKIIKPLTATKGYLSVCVKKKNGEKKYILLHRLVLSTWQPREDMDYLTVDHKNHNKRDNSLKNLEWVTEKENSNRAKMDQLEISIANILINKEENKHFDSKIIFHRGQQFVNFSSVEEAVKMVKIFNSNSGSEEEIVKKICRSSLTGKKIYGGYWDIKQ